MSISSDSVAVRRPALVGITAGAITVMMVCLLATTPAAATDVLAGSDILFSPSGQTHQDFSGTPIPADFFGPGSDPFDGIIYFVGDQFPVPGPSGTEEVDAIVQRLEDAHLSSGEDTVPTRMIALRLVSTSPITVTFYGGTQSSTYDVLVCLSSYYGQPQGWMTIRRQTPAGGDFDSLTPVRPRFVFTKVSGGPGNNQAEGELMDALNFEVWGGCWSHEAPPGYNLYTTYGGWVDHDCDPGTPDVDYPPSSPPPNGFFLGVCDGSSVVQTDEDALLAAHGIYPGLDPDETGACCDWDTLDCWDGIDVTECYNICPWCEWLGAGSTCAMDCQLQETGACCDWGTLDCWDGVDEYECYNLCPWCEWLGPGTTCAVDCQLQETGACCDWDTLDCWDGMSEADCYNMYPGYDWLGPGSTCIDDCVLPDEGCCLPSGQCWDLPINECLMKEGNPQGQLCTGTIEACCLPDGSCLEIDLLCCDDLGGVPGYEPLCLGDLNGNGIDDACEAPEACCMEDGTCVDGVNPGNCIAQGGTPQGPGSICTGTLEACCLVDGTCMDVDPLCCDDLGGTSQGPGTACSGLLEACCFDDGLCLDADPVCCGFLGGWSQGPGTACSGLLEACCFDDGTCLDADPLCCEFLGGWSQGPGTACVFTTIACCFPDGSCMDVDPICCDDLGGVPGYAAMCLGDMNGNGIDDACEPPKWEQPPDLFETGMDVNASWLFGEIPYVLADDFNCTQPGPLTRIHVWGSWYQDYMPFGDPMNVTFTLSIHEDIPIGPDGHSIPGELLWMRMFDPGEFAIGSVVGDLNEGWFNPPDYYEWPGDTICFEYIFFLEPSEFFQQGSPNCPVVYWLDVHADPHDIQAMFGWKTTPLEFQWNDNAVWGDGIEPYLGPWYELYYPMDHPWAGAPLDLAFSIYGIEYPVCPGDANCDGEINWRDIDFFVAAMNDNYAAWAAMFLPGVPTCPFANNDANADGTVNWRDIDPFVAVMNTTCP
ncbi:MAG: hypothetical protein KAY37_09355 [Phycisphaerae bacterium]|nr:hypothetical protein [Phycisphaerae bacterium]